MKFMQEILSDYYSAKSIFNNSNIKETLTKHVPPVFNMEKKLLNIESHPYFSETIKKTFSVRHNLRQSRVCLWKKNPKQTVSTQQDF